MSVNNLKATGGYAQVVDELSPPRPPARYKIQLPEPVTPDPVPEPTDDPSVNSGAIDVPNTGSEDQSNTASLIVTASILLLLLLLAFALPSQSAPVAAPTSNLTSKKVALTPGPLFNELTLAFRAPSVLYPYHDRQNYTQWSIPPKT